jgi:hypothetical protein
MADTSRFVASMAISLFVSAFLISYVLMGAYGVDLNTGLELPSTGNTYASEQNFATGSYDKNTFSQVGSGVWSNILNQGMTLISGEGYLLVDNINTDSGIITNEYKINNSRMQDYSIVLYYSGGLDQNILVVADNGFYITGQGEKLYPRDFIPYSWASRFTPVIITTTYDRNTHSASWVLNNNPTTTFASTKLAKEDTNYLGLFPRAYGGVKSSTTGFAVQSFNSANNLNSDNGVSTNPFVLLVSLFKTMVAIIVWNVPVQYLPWELNILLIKTQAAALFIGLAGLFRGNV